MHGHHARPARPGRHPDFAESWQRRFPNPGVPLSRRLPAPAYRRGIDKEAPMQQAQRDLVIAALLGARRGRSARSPRPGPSARRLGQATTAPSTRRRAREDSSTPSRRRSTARSPEAAGAAGVPKARPPRTARARASSYRAPAARRRHDAHAPRRRRRYEHDGEEAAMTSHVGRLYVARARARRLLPRLGHARRAPVGRAAHARPAPPRCRARAAAPRQEAKLVNAGRRRSAGPRTARS